VSVYHVFVPALAQRALTHIRRHDVLSAGDRVGVAVSGGIDSVALLRLLLELRGELGIVLSVVHFNHKLRGVESDADLEFVAGLAREFGLEFYCDGDETAAYAAEEHSSLEAAARELRYGFFHNLLGEGEGQLCGADDPQGLKPKSLSPSDGTSELVPFPQSPPDGASEVAQLPQSPQDGTDEPQGLKPASSTPGNGTTEVVPFPTSTELVPFPSLTEVALFQSSTAKGALLDKICTGHTLDDQAETVLMRVIRGTGLKGLGAIHPRLLVEDEGGEVVGEIVRPLLEFRRVELEQYLRELGQPWREDASNADDKFTRNRIRHTLMPLLEREFNPSVAENLAELAEIARGEEDYWENEASGWMGRAVQWAEPDWVPGQAKSLSQRGTGDLTEEHRLLVHIQPASSESRGVASRSVDRGLESRIDHAPWLVVNGAVNRMWLLGEPIAVQRRVIKAMGDHVRLPLEFKHVDEILRFAVDEGEAGKELSLPLGWKVVRHPDELVLLTPDLRRHDADLEPGGDDYEYELPVPGCVLVAEARASFETQLVISPATGGAIDSELLLDAASLPGSLRVRNWRAGDRFWPAHTKSAKKIKELLQGRASGPEERKLWPVIVSADVIVWVRGFLPPAKFQAKPGRGAVLIAERALDRLSGSRDQSRGKS
jgi:tRNA(Ile)-lysidine synthetase-like protein